MLFVITWRRISKLYPRMLVTRHTVFESVEQLLTLCSQHLLIPACRARFVLVIYARRVSIMASVEDVLGSSPQRPDGGSPRKPFDIEAEKASLRRFIQGTSNTAAGLRQRKPLSGKSKESSTRLTTKTSGAKKTDVKVDPDAEDSEDAEDGEEETPEVDEIDEDAKGKVMRKPAASKKPAAASKEDSEDAEDGEEETQEVDELDEGATGKVMRKPAASKKPASAPKPAAKAKAKAKGIAGKIAVNKRPAADATSDKDAVDETPVAKTRKGGGGTPPQKAGDACDAGENEEADEDTEIGRARGKARRFKKDRMNGKIPADVLEEYDKLVSMHKASGSSWIIGHNAHPPPPT